MANQRGGQHFTIPLIDAIDTNGKPADSFQCFQNLLISVYWCSLLVFSAASQQSENLERLVENPYGPPKLASG
jgi:hypothetical protein